MGFPTASHASSAQAHLVSEESTDFPDILPQSREMGDVVPESSQSPVQDADNKLKAKPFAHFVAGGCVGRACFSIVPL